MSRGMSRGISPPDPFVLNDSFNISQFRSMRRGTENLSRRSATINTGVKNLVLICAGQSNMANVIPTRVAPTNSSAIDQMNIYDGGLYSVDGSLLGCSNEDAVHGSACTQVADKFVTGGQFSRVILLNCSINTTTAAMWATWTLANRIPVAMRRLAAKGITPSVTNVTFAVWWGQGESDQGTSSASYQASLNTILTNAKAAGFSGRFFVCKQTLFNNVTDSTIQSAQTGLVDNANFWSGGDMDALTGANRQGDNTHWSDTGGANAATAVYNAMRASGAPF
jgi:hypothetical protein